MPKRCIDCGKAGANFNFIGLKNEYCGKCRKDGMIDLKTKKCEKCNYKTAIFGYENENIKRRCGDCQEEYMINLNRPRCLKCKNKTRYFNFNGLPPLYCNDCKEEGMINVVSKKCEKCNIKCAIYNYEGEKYGKYCNDCKLETMINVESNKCVECNNSRALFNYENEKTPKYCGKCKKEGMFDLNCNKCIKCNITVASYNYEGETKRLYCNDCKLEGMINICSNKCIKCNIKYAIFNYKGDTRGLYCNDCKLEGMINIKSKLCINCENTCQNFNLKPYCSRCFYKLNPEIPKPRNYKMKQNIITDELLTRTCIMFDSYDKIIQGSNCLYRPDIFKDCLSHSIIIEIDENSHKKYCEENENNRIEKIHYGLNKRPLTVIRFNPDKYKKCKGIFTKDVDIIEEPFNNRMKKLCEIVQHNINVVPEKSINIIKLYID